METRFTARRRMAIVLALCLSAFLISVDVTIVNVALPTLVRPLGATTTQLQWVVDAYSLVFAALVLAAGSLSDRQGRKGMLLAGLGVFAAGSLAGALECQFAGNAWQDNGLVFCQPDGRPWNPDYVSKRFKRLAADAGVPPIKLHETRHSANSQLRGRVDQELRMQIVGHAAKDINDRYTHTLEEAHRAAAEQTAAYVLGDLS